MRQQAAEYVCSLTSTPEGCKLISNKQGHLVLSKLLGDSIVCFESCDNAQTTSKYAITALINMCEDTGVLTDIANDELVDKLMENLMVCSLPRL